MAILTLAKLPSTVMVRDFLNAGDSVPPARVPPSFDPDSAEKHSVIAGVGGLAFDLERAGQR